MRNRRNPKKNLCSPRRETNNCGGGGGGGGNHSKFASFDFNDDDLHVEAARKSCSKFALKSPSKRPAYSKPLDKYRFLMDFGGTMTQQNGPGKETSKVDISDDFLEDGAIRPDAMPLPLPGSMFQSLSLSVNPECSSCGTTRSCAYSSRNSGGRINEKKQKPVACIDSDEDGRIDSQTSTSFRLAKNKGSLGERSSHHGSKGNDCEAVVVVSPKYIKYENMNYTKCSLTFSSGFIRLEGLPLHGRKRPHRLAWSTSDIVKIEYQLCESVKADVVNLQLAFDDANVDETCSRKSGIKELEFVVIDDPQWSKKQEEIKSLNVKYEAAWETIMSECSSKEHFDGMAYPEEDPDAVFICESDVERLQPGTFINDTIIDFYTKYLVINVIKPKEQKRFHFFNTFFFRKLADIDQVFPKSCEGRQAFQRVRKWTRNLDLFEKDFIFIPVNFSLHWSLIVICYPGELANLRDKHSNEASMRPCILHMDSIRGCHGGFDNLIRSYLWEEWKERSDKQDADIQARFLNLPFDRLKLPQQENLFDCGIFLLHYAECFLAMAANFSTIRYSNILNEGWFIPAEVSIKKRDEIRRLIYRLAEGSKNPPVACNDSHLSSVVNEGDSGIKVLDKETFEGSMFSPCIDHQIGRQQSFSDMLEQEKTSMSGNDESVQHCEQVSSMRLPMEQNAIEMEDSSLPGATTSRYEADKDDKTSPSCSPSSLWVGKIEVPFSTTKTRAGISPIIIDAHNEEDCVTEVASTPEKQKGKDLYSTMSSKDLADCIVEDSEEETVIESTPKTRRPWFY